MNYAITSVQLINIIDTDCLFIDLRDQYGVTQVVVSGDEEKVDLDEKTNNVNKCYCY